jgi:hypothetical protein
MSDWARDRSLVEEWVPPALLLFVLAPVALVRFLGGAWGTLAVLVGWLLVAAVLGLVGWRVWVRVQGWRADRALAREEAGGYSLAEVSDNLKKL